MYGKHVGFFFFFCILLFDLHIRYHFAGMSHILYHAGRFFWEDHDGHSLLLIVIWYCAHLPISVSAYMILLNLPPLSSDAGISPFFLFVGKMLVELIKKWDIHVRKNWEPKTFWLFASCDSYYLICLLNSFISARALGLIVVLTPKQCFSASSMFNWIFISSVMQHIRVNIDVHYSEILVHQYVVMSQIDVNCYQTFFCSYLSRHVQQPWTLSCKHHMYLY